ncbi:MAG: hypothetical protein ABIC82_06525 [bacterium]
MEKNIKYKINRKIFISTLITSIFFVLLSFNIVLAQSSMKEILISTAGESGAGFSTATNISLSEYIGSIIKYALSFLGVIFICLTIYGGFLWMLARGDSEEVKKAKDIITSSVIGLVIVISAYTLVYNLFYFLFSDKGIV